MLQIILALAVHSVVFFGVFYFFYNKKVKSMNQLIEKLNSEQLESESVKIRLLTTEKDSEITDLKNTNEQLMELVSSMTERLNKTESDFEDNKKQLELSSQRLVDFRNQLKNNTDLELATIDQILDELKTRKVRFLMLRPGINEMVDATASQVSKNDAIVVLRAALAGLKESESWKDSDEDDWTV